MYVSEETSNAYMMQCSLLAKIVTIVLFSTRLSSKCIYILHIHTHIYICVYVYVYIFMYTNMYVFEIKQSSSHAATSVWHRKLHTAIKNRKKNT